MEAKYQDLHTLGQVDGLCQPILRQSVIKPEQRVTSVVVFEPCLLLSLLKCDILHIVQPRCTSGQRHTCLYSPHQAAGQL